MILGIFIYKSRYIINDIRNIILFLTLKSKILFDAGVKVGLCVSPENGPEVVRNLIWEAAYTMERGIYLYYLVYNISL
jgi:hypothetical protein